MASRCNLVCCLDRDRRAPVDPLAKLRACDTGAACERHLGLAACECGLDQFVQVACDWLHKTTSTLSRACWEPLCRASRGQSGEESGLFDGDAKVSHVPERLADEVGGALLDAPPELCVADCDNFHAARRVPSASRFVASRLVVCCVAHLIVSFFPPPAIRWADA